MGLILSLILVCLMFLYIMVKWSSTSMWMISLSFVVGYAPWFKDVIFLVICSIFEGISSSCCEFTVLGGLILSFSSFQMFSIYHAVRMCCSSHLLAVLRVLGFIVRCLSGLHFYQVSKIPLVTVVG